MKPIWGTPLAPLKCLGSTLLPPLFGLISGTLGFWLLPVFAGVFLLLCAAMTGRAFRLAGQDRGASET